MELTPLIEPQYNQLDFLKPTLNRLDGQGGYKEDKMIAAMSEMVSVDPTHHAYYAFYVDMPATALEELLNFGGLKIVFWTEVNSKGIISGSLNDFVRTIQLLCNSDSKGMRALGAMFHSFFAKRVPDQFRSKKLLMLGDGTFNMR